MKIQTVKQQPHAYGYTCPHPLTKQGMQPQVYTWSVSICCITLHFHLEFGDFLYSQSNFQKDALFFLPSRHYGTRDKDSERWAQRQTKTKFSGLPMPNRILSSWRQRYEIYLNTTKEKPGLFLQAAKKENGELTFCHFVHRDHPWFSYSGVHRTASTNTRISRLTP